MGSIGSNFLLLDTSSTPLEKAHFQQLFNLSGPLWIRFLPVWMACP
jgi:hypothetical protein